MGVEIVLGVGCEKPTGAGMPRPLAFLGRMCVGDANRLAYYSLFLYALTRITPILTALDACGGSRVFDKIILRDEERARAANRHLPFGAYAVEHNAEGC